MLSAEAAVAWEELGMPALWGYYTDFEVVSVRDAGTSTFEARIRLRPYTGRPVVERLLMRAGTDMDGVRRDLVIVDAEPA